MPTRSLTVGERLARIEGRFDESDANARELWRRNDDALKGLAGLPERLARERGEDRGQTEGRLNAVVADLRRTITDAVEKAIEPLTATQADHEKRLDSLEKQGNALTTARLIIVFIVQTFIAAATAFAGAYALTRGVHP